MTEELLVFPLEILTIGVSVGRHRFHNLPEACLAVAGAVSEAMDAGPTRYEIESLTLTPEDLEGCIGLVERFLSPGKAH